METTICSTRGDFVYDGAWGDYVRHVTNDEPHPCVLCGEPCESVTVANGERVTWLHFWCIPLAEPSVD